MIYSVQLRYAFRTGALTGVAAGRLFRVFARSTAGHVAAWEKQQELRTGKWNSHDHTFVVPGGDETRGRVLHLSRGAERAVPGRSFTSMCDVPRRERALFVDDGVGGCFIHGWPPCRCARCIVLHHGLDELESAVGSGGTLTIVG
jgi:hypothetical protein